MKVVSRRKIGMLIVPMIMLSGVLALPPGVHASEALNYVQL